MSNNIGLLDGSVQSQGIRVSAADWLDIGSTGWKDVPNKIKAAAYQAALITGWTDAGLRCLMIHAWSPRIDDDMATFILNLLKEFSQEFPVEKIGNEEPSLTLHPKDEKSIMVKIASK